MLISFMSDGMWYIILLLEVWTASSTAHFSTVLPHSSPLTKTGLEFT